MASFTGTSSPSSSAATDNTVQYHKTSIGLALESALVELVEARSISPDLMAHVMNNFSSVIVQRLSQVKHKAEIQGESKDYRNIKDCWTIQLRNCGVTIDKSETIKVDKMTVFTSK